KALLLDTKFWVFDHGPKLFSSVDRIYVDVLPRDWNDIWSGRRRIAFRVAYHEVTDYGGHINWTRDSDVVARINGVEATDLPGYRILDSYIETSLVDRKSVV